jgi:hypothetical protein
MLRRPTTDVTDATRAGPETMFLSLLSKLTALDRSDRRLVLEAASLMAVVWAGLRVMRLPTLRRILDRYAAAGSPIRPREPQSTARVRWAVAAVAARSSSATCLVQALAADALLRRRGVASELRIGVRTGRDPGVPLEAHAWVESGGAVVTGAIAELSEYKVLNRPGPL